MSADMDDEADIIARFTAEIEETQRRLRAEGAAAERAAIVAWLRKRGPAYARYIEDGAHLLSKTKS